MLARNALAALALLLGGCAALSGSESSSTDESALDPSAPGATRPHLLALGDSMTYAWNPHLESDPHKVDPKNYVGFAEMLGNELDFPVDNAACPGEASGA